jgi:hypothetical protein
MMTRWMGRWDDNLVYSGWKTGVVSTGEASSARATPGSGAGIDKLTPGDSLLFARPSAHNQHIHNPYYFCFLFLRKK